MPESLFIGLQRAIFHYQRHNMFIIFPRPIVFSAFILLLWAASIASVQANPSTAEQGADKPPIPAQKVFTTELILFEVQLVQGGEFVIVERPYNLDSSFEIPACWDRRALLEGITVEDIQGYADDLTRLGVKRAKLTISPLCS